MTFRSLLLTPLSFLSLFAIVSAQDRPVSAIRAIHAAQAVGVKRALLFCGHPGDDEHRVAFLESLEKIRNGLVDRLGFDPAAIDTFFGVDAEKDEARPGSLAVRGPATRAALTERVAALRNGLQPNDTLWVIAIGHAHFDGRSAWLNLPGPDIQQDEFAKLFQGLECREQIFVITTPVSGYYLRPLSAKGRIVITATEADLEVNETLFPHALAELLNPLADALPVDADGDGRLSVFDLYIAVARNIAQRYLSDELLSTEHALLDDNGDGRGTELQLDFLSEEEGGRKRRGPLTVPMPGTDGALSALTACWLE